MTLGSGHKWRLVGLRHSTLRTGCPQHCGDGQLEEQSANATPHEFRALAAT